MLRLHLDRISDIALHEQEAHQESFTSLNLVKGRLSLENVSFSYGANEPDVINNLSLDIQAGESIAIVGASGCGKTTLVKLMLGLLMPTNGRVLLDGQNITHIGLMQYRQQIAAVMQADTLSSGSIAENITFFDPEPNYYGMQ